MKHKMSKLKRRVVKVEFRGGGIIRGVLYEPKIVKDGKVHEGIYLIRYLDKEKKVVVGDMLEVAGRRGVEIEDIVPSRMPTAKMSKCLRDYEKSLDKAQKEERDKMVNGGKAGEELEGRIRKYVDINPSTWDSEDPRFLIKEVKEESVILRIEIEKDDGDEGKDIGIEMKREHDGVMTIRNIKPDFYKILEREYPSLTEERVRGVLDFGGRKVLKIVNGANVRKNTEHVNLFWVIELEISSRVKDIDLEYLENEVGRLAGGTRTSRRGMIM